MMPVLLSKHHARCRRKDKRPPCLLVVERKYISVLWNVDLNITIIRRIVSSCLSASLIGQEFPTRERKRKRDKKRVQLGL